jgi:periplasmic protein TonB
LCLWVDGGHHCRRGAGRRIFALPPHYTEKARKARLQGIVILESIIDREGCVQDIHVLKGMPMGLDRAALEAARNWVFEPATVEGKPVKVYYTLTVNFQIEEDSKTPAAAPP